MQIARGRGGGRIYVWTINANRAERIGRKITADAFLWRFQETRRALNRARAR